MILKYGEISSCRYPSLLCCLNQLFVMFFQLISQKQTLFVCGVMVKRMVISGQFTAAIGS